MPAKNPTSPRPPKPSSTVRCPTYTGPGRFCGKSFTYRDGYETDSGKVVCPDCAPGRLVKMAKPVAEKKWYVLQVAPGGDARARLDLLRKAKDFGLKDKVGRVMVPRRFEEKMVEPAGPTLAEGTGHGSRHDAWAKAEKAVVDKIVDETGCRPEAVRDEHWREKYKIVTYQDEKTGRWCWKVRERGRPTRAVVKAKKYPGYVLCQLEYGPGVADLVKQVRGSAGLLLRPVVKVDPKFKLSASKRHGWSWRVYDVTGTAVLASGVHKSRVTAEVHARDKVRELALFKPVAMDSAEAAEELLEQKAVNQIDKDKTEKYKVLNVDLKPGDRVRVTDPLWKNVEGTVAHVSRKDKTYPIVHVALEVMGTTVRVTAAYTDCTRI